MCLRRGPWCDRVCPGDGLVGGVFSGVAQSGCRRQMGSGAEGWRQTAHDVHLHVHDAMVHGRRLVRGDVLRDAA